MKIENIQLHISEHAHKQYCERVEHIDYDQLTADCIEQLQRRSYLNKNDEFIQLSDVWWVYATNDDCVVTFITCYGRMHMNLPRALRWAECNKDKINITLSF
jgi:hypothetical protein